MQRAQEAGAHPLDVEFGAVTAGFHHLRHAHVGGFEGGKALFTAHAAAAAADAVAIVTDTRINHLGIGTAAERAFHGFTILLVSIA
ncbi:hypothetical protein D3C85_1529150 [compost metagenome]